VSNERELVGSLTQARVQMIAADAILLGKINDVSTKMSTDMTSEDRTIAKAEYDAVVLDKQKLARAAAVVRDVRARYERPNRS